MKRTIVAAACLVALAAPAVAQSVKDGAIAVRQSEGVVTVLEVDVQKRSVTIRSPDGSMKTLQVPPQAQNLDRVKKGDRFRVRYVEAVAVGIRKGGEPAASDKEDVRVAPKGADPGGVIVRTQERAFVVDAIDAKNRSIAAHGSDGAVQAFAVADDVPLEQLAVGDRVAIRHTEAFALQLEPQPAGKAK